MTILSSTSMSSSTAQLALEKSFTMFSSEEGIDVTASSLTQFPHSIVASPTDSPRTEMFATVFGSRTLDMAKVAVFIQRQNNAVVFKVSDLFETQILQTQLLALNHELCIHYPWLGKHYVYCCGVSQ